MRWVLAVLTVLGGAACEGNNSVSYHYQTSGGDGGALAGDSSGGTHASGTSAMGGSAIAGTNVGAIGGAAAGEPSSTAGDTAIGGEVAVGGAVSEGGAAGGAAPTCSVAADCGAKTDCAVPACRNGSCEVSLVPEGTFVRFDETPCHAVVCDGAGHTKLVADARNPPGITHDCSVLKCAQDGSVVETRAPLGASCGGNNAQRCDIAGDCVDCIAKQDCQGGLACIQGKCQTPADNCSSQHIDAGETDIDCGGKTCAPCGNGADCYADSDCASQSCDFRAPERCVADHCVDHHMSGDETDQDCGGPTCAACTEGHACKVDGDCTSGLCHPKFHFCLPDHCSDKIQDVGETGLDCGNGCYGCALGSDCLSNFDCLSNACDANSQKCIADACQDHHVDGDETDADCGGSTCARCPIGKKCLTTSDCAPGGTCPANPPRACY